MKIRTDFVTNSSSSSFIIALNPKNIKDINKYSNIDYKLTIDQIKKNSDTLGTDKQLSDILKDEFYLDDDIEILINEECKAMYLKYVSYMEKGYELFYLNRISNCSDAYDLFYELEEINNKDILEINSFDH